MSVFAEQSTSLRNRRVHPTLAQPLPRLTDLPHHDGLHEKYEVVICGAGPAGSFLNLLLARYGLGDVSLLCIDAKPASVKTGQADGLAARTLEVLKTLDLVDEIQNHGFHVSESGTWNSQTSDAADGPSPGIKRTEVRPVQFSPARLAQAITIHQGRIERIFEEDLLKYSKRGVERSSRLVSVHIDEDGDAEFPVVADIEHEGIQRTVRTKYLVGADGAHSVVRQSMGSQMEGDTMDDIWGVVDFVADTDFPDIRRHCEIHSDAGNIMVIPREQLPTGDYLSRLYVQTKEDVPTDADKAIVSDGSADKLRKYDYKLKERRSRVSPETIFRQADKIFRPYRICPKKGTEIDWWAAYQIGQRVAKEFLQKDLKGVPRVFIVGDACHTHSPKMGQGMNVGIMDSYNVAWKLMYSINGLVEDAPKLLDTYHTERHEIADKLIELDQKVYASRWADATGKERPHLQTMIEVVSFASGCGIEYNKGLLTNREKEITHGVLTSTDYAAGVLREGRRILDVQTIRFADGTPRHLHDDLLSNGRLRVIVLASNDLLDAAGVSASTLINLCGSVLPQYPPKVIELIILQPLGLHSFEWVDIPACVKKEAEMRFHVADAAVYATYGVDPAIGALVVVRPDGYIGTIAHLGDVERVNSYLQRWVKVIK
ncbi:MAG: hypothetical protein Q9187_001459 [Circinaria calcarea]